MYNTVDGFFPQAVEYSGQGEPMNYKCSRREQGEERVREGERGGERGVNLCWPQPSFSI